ncbi:Xylose isomerase [Enterobacter asburiae]|uniref:xylose isomerase n=1 Tax=Enterobacter asburiae TaxID=61645 RepID=A0A376FIC8_ENTAS|nr:Xylose isomerase [Enterobacter asburiae]
MATVYGFLKQFGLEKEIKVNIEANHATLAATLSITRSRLPLRWAFSALSMRTVAMHSLGWDTDQFPNSVEENALVMYEIVKAGGFTTGGLNFDRQGTSSEHRQIRSVSTATLARWTPWRWR